jgi:putative ABC transport system substrate-binding protein
MITKSFALFCLLVTVSLITGLADAQQPTKIPRIGFQSAALPAAVSARVEAFRQGLHELGYVEGKNIVVAYRYGDGKLDRLDEFAAEFVRLKVDVIVTAAPTSTRAAKKATSTIPIVMAFDIDPVGNGFVASLARPGGNITGLSTLSPEITGKQLELLKEIIPKLSHVAVLGTRGLVTDQMLREVKPAAAALKVELQQLDVRGPQDIETAFRDARKGRAGAVLVLASPFLESRRREVADFATSSLRFTTAKNL